MAVMALALLPLALLSYAQGVQGARLSDSRVTAAILGETLVAAAPITAEIVKAQGKAATLAAVMPAVMRSEENGDVGLCDRLMNQVVDASIGMVVVAGFTKANGDMDCASNGRYGNFGDNSRFAELLHYGGPAMTVNPVSTLSPGDSVIVFSHPVVGRSGTVLGLVSLLLPHSALQARVPPEYQDGYQALTLATFDSSGALLTSSLGLKNASAGLPVGASLAELARATEMGGQSFVGPTAFHERRAFAVVALQPGALYLIGSWPADRLQVSVLEGTFPAFFFPLLMWAASMIAAWFAAESQVLRHVRSLRDSISSFAAGERRGKPLDMEDAAIELRVVGRAYERMTDAVLRNEADLENTIHEKEVLLREVHHRVKNNLQLIVSIMNMQIRAAHSPEAKAVMRTVQERVISLATVHSELYQTSALTSVRADELLSRVARDLLKLGAVPGKAFDLETIIPDDIRLTPDQAVPLALFLTEGMANVLKHAWAGGGKRSRIELRLQRIGAEQLRFSLTNDLSAPDISAAEKLRSGRSGFGAQLLSAFAMQLGGVVQTTAAGGQYMLTMEFPLASLRKVQSV